MPAHSRFSAVRPVNTGANTEGPLTLLYLDRHCAVVDKPGGLLAVPGRGPDKQDCLTARLRQLCPWSIEQPAAHRLDMATSGLMVLGLSSEAQRRLSRQFAERQVAKMYLAILEGEPAGQGGVIRLAFRLDPTRRPYQVYDPLQGKTGLTYWQKLECHGGTSLVALWPHTGRTHQLRLHTSHPLGLGCPIAGDRLYGSGEPGEQLCLHAAYLSFLHPASGRCMRFCSQPPFVHALDGFSPRYLETALAHSMHSSVAALGLSEPISELRCSLPM